jgi:Polysaccharide deacetylase
VGSGHRVLTIVLIMGLTQMVSLAQNRTFISGIVCQGLVGQQVVAQVAPVRRRPNVMGKVFVAEYHHIRAGKGDMVRPPSEFRHDLERLYRDGFRPCTVSQYLADRMMLPSGTSPVVMTFDDANPSQFQLKKDGSVDPNCAVGIWQAFAQKHPDFPVRATFYVLPKVMWGQPAFRSKKVSLLRGWGCELGNHTVSHPILKRLTDDQVRKELADASDALQKWGEPLPPSLALPFGISPRNKGLTHEFSYHGRSYSFSGMFLVGAEPSRSPRDPKLDRFRIPRIQGYSGPNGLNQWLGRFEKGEIKTYVAP